MARPQHHRGKKRLKKWHRGKGEAHRWENRQLPDVGSGADPTTGQPIRLRRNQPGGRVHGDSI